MKRFTVTVLMLCLMAVSALAQGTTGRLTGTVSGPDGVIAGATITVTDTQTNREVTAQSSDDGTFAVPQLEFGTYTVRITAPGFSTFVATDLKIDVGREYSLNSTLQVGEISQEVTVTAGADLLNATNAEVSNSVSPVQIQELPLDGRSPLDLITLQAGTSNTGGNTSINGQRTAFSNITRDGINVQDNFIRANATDFSPERSSTDDTGEFTIVTSNQGAESGYGSAQISQVTPRGQNEFNGSLYAYNRNSSFAANTFSGNASGNLSNGEEVSPRAYLNRNQFGGRISGPVPLPRFGEGGSRLIRNKAFFFFNTEQQIQRESDNFTTTVLTQSARNGLFTFRDAGGALRQVNIFSLPTTGGAGTAPTGIDPIVQSRIIAGLPLPNVPGGDNLNTAGFDETRVQNSEQRNYTGRFDVDFNDSNTARIVISDKREELLRPDVDLNTFGPIAPVTQPAISKFLSAAYRFTPSANFSNETIGGYNFIDAIFDRTAPIPGNFFNSALITEPEIRFLDQGRTQRNYSIQNNSQLTLADHSIRFGGIGQFFRINPFNDAGTVPTFTLGTGANTPQITAASFANVPGGANIPQVNITRANNLLSLLGGIVSGGTQSFTPSSVNGPFLVAGNREDFKYENYGFYAGDTWRISPRFTLSYGLRYELTTALRLGNGLLLEPVIPEGTDPVQAILNPNGRFQPVGGNAGGNNQLFKTDRNNFAPNIGFAYQPNFKNRFLNSFLPGEGRTVIRGGYAISYPQDQVLTSSRNAGRSNVGLGTTPVNATVNVNGTPTANLNLRPGTVGTATLNAPAPFTQGPTFAQNNTASVANNFGTAFAIDPNLQNARVQQYNIGISREIGFQTAIEVRYVGSRSNNLLRAIDYNQINISNGGFFDDFQRARANLAASGAANNPFFTGPGSQPLQVFGTAETSRLRVGTGGLSNAVFINNLQNGTPAELAFEFIRTNNDQNTANGQFPFVPNPNIGVADLVANGAFFNYNSLQAEIRRRFAQGIYFQANYTFAKNLSNAVGTEQALFDPFLDINRPELERARADFDQTHAFNLNTIFELPLGRGKRFFDTTGGIDRLIGGLVLGTNLRFGSGQPVTLVDPRGTFNRGGRSGRQTVFTTLSKDEVKNLFGRFEQNGVVYFINPAVLGPDGSATGGNVNATPANPAFPGQVFFNAQAGQTGNLERGFINSPSIFNLDVSLTKDIQITEGTRIRLIGQAFNVTNRANFRFNTDAASGRLLDINSATFGRLDPTFDFGEARRLQFAFRFEF